MWSAFTSKEHVYLIVYLGHPKMEAQADLPLPCWDYSVESGATDYVARNCNICLKYQDFQYSPIYYFPWTMKTF